MLGRHLLVELTGCPPGRLNDVAALEQICVRATRNAGAAVVSSSFHPFAPHGVSGVVVIHESHVAVHTWPEHGYVALDVFTCGDAIDPHTVADAIESALQATGSQPRMVPRGEPFEAHASAPTAPFTGSADRSIWFTDRDADIALSLRATGALFRRTSDHQKVEVLETAGYGRMLVLDDRIVCTEHDEHIYHEMLVHVPALTAEHPVRALVLGGGDGGAARELLRHPSIASIDVVEIDETVVRAAREHLPTMSTALDDDRVTLHIADGREFLRRVDPGTIDLLLVDSGAASGPADALFTSEFYADVRRALKDGGRFVTQVPPPTLSGDDFATLCRRMRSAIGFVAPYLAYIPTYNTGMLAFAFASRDALDPRVIDDATTEQFARRQGLRYYTGDIHRASFALPASVAALISEG